MNKFLPYVSLQALIFSFTLYGSHAMDYPQADQISMAQRSQNAQNAKAYFTSTVSPKIALYGEGDAHTRESDYTQFLTVDADPLTRPKINADITNLEDMAVIPSGQLDCVELRDIPSGVFSKKPATTFGDILRVLKQGGTLKFNDNMWGAKDVAPIKSAFLESKAELKTSSPATYTKWENTPADTIVKALRRHDLLNPFDQYLEKNELETLLSKKFTETPLWAAYREQLSTFFERIGFTDLTYHTENSGFWTVRKK